MKKQKTFLAKLLFDIEGKLPHNVKDTGIIPPSFDYWHYGHVYELPDGFGMEWFEKYKEIKDE